MTADLVTVGRVVKPHGIRGELVVLVLTDIEDRFYVGSTLDLAGPNRVRGTLTIASTRPHRGGLLIKFEEVADRNDAERWRGAELLAPRRDPASLDRFTVDELVGLDVMAEDEANLGVVEAIASLAGANYDLLKVRKNDGATWLLPIADYVTIVTDDQGNAQLIRLDGAPEGLTEL